MGSLSTVNPMYFFMGVGAFSVFLSRFGTHLVMPPWVAATLQWGGWALIVFGLLQWLGVFEFVNEIPI